MTQINHSADLTFPELTYGTHETPYDLTTLLYAGGSAARRDTFSTLKAEGALGELISSRLPLVINIHNAIASDISKGLSRESITGTISALRYFFIWCDKERIYLTLETVAHSYISWSEHLLHRVRVEKNLKNKSAYGYAKRVDYLLSKILNSERGLFRMTRLTPPSLPLNGKSDKLDLKKAFEYGHLLLDICNALTFEAIRGPLPIQINLQSGKILVESGRMKADCKLKSLKAGAPIAEKKLAIKRRSSLPDEISTLQRSNLVNLRIECEIFIFISQTGMNLSQAILCKREKFRYQTDNDETIVYRTYKGRRSGEALFRIFKEYAEIFRRYIDWLDRTFPDKEERLFPFLYSSVVPRLTRSPSLQNVRHRCQKLNITHYGSRALRKLRINWLLRTSANPDLTAEMAQHTKEILFNHYAKPQHQIAAIEISKFHQLTDPSISPPAPGLCVGNYGFPIQVDGIPEDAPQPDCGNAAGCFFCIHHRDIDTEDYIWSLMSYRYCKQLELDRHIPKPSENKKPPAALLIEQLTLKLNAFQSSSAIRSAWLQEAKHRIREGRYHPAFDGIIQIMETY